jgi:hypothetical protein
MKVPILFIFLMLFKSYNERIKGFERITASLAGEVDKQLKEINLLKQRRYKKSSSLQQVT